MNTSDEAGAGRSQWYGDDASRYPETRPLGGSGLAAAEADPPEDGPADTPEEPAAVTSKDTENSEDSEDTTDESAEAPGTPAGEPVDELDKGAVQVDEDEPGEADGAPPREPAPSGGDTTRVDLAAVRPRPPARDEPAETDGTPAPEGPVAQDGTPVPVKQDVPDDKPPARPHADVTRVDVPAMTPAKAGDKADAKAEEKPEDDWKPLPPSAHRLPDPRETVRDQAAAPVDHDLPKPRTFRTEGSPPEPTDTPPDEPLSERWNRLFADDPVPMPAQEPEPAPVPATAQAQAEEPSGQAAMGPPPAFAAPPLPHPPGLWHRLHFPIGVFLAFFGVTATVTAALRWDDHNDRMATLLHDTLGLGSGAATGVLIGAHVVELLLTLVALAGLTRRRYVWYLPALFGWIAGYGVFAALDVWAGEYGRLAQHAGYLVVFVALLLVSYVLGVKVRAAGRQAPPPGGAGVPGPQQRLTRTQEMALAALSRWQQQQPRP